MRTLLLVALPPLCKGRWRGNAVTEGLYSKPNSKIVSAVIKTLNGFDSRRELRGSVSLAA